MITCSEKDDENDISIGLSSSDVDYLNRATNEISKDAFNKNNDVVVSDVLPEYTVPSELPLGFIQNNLGLNKPYSGELPVNLSPVDNSTDNVVNAKIAANQFVQVASQCTSDVLGAQIPNQMQVVGNQLNSLLTHYTSTTPTLTNQVTEISQLGSVLSLEQASITTSSVDNIPLINILPCGQIVENKNVGGKNPNTPQMFLLTMTVDDSNGEQTETNEKAEEKTEDAQNNTSTIASQLPEPQCASTPILRADNELQTLNDTILAGNVNPATSDTVAPTEKELVVPKNINNKNMEPKKKPDENGTANAERRKITTGTKPCRQIQVEAKEEKEPKLNESRTHNETYCKDWVAKVTCTPTEMNDTLAQNEPSSVENTSLSSSNLNITSVSRKTPEYRCDENDKFVSQRTRKDRNTTVSKKKNDQSPIW